MDEFVKRKLDGIEYIPVKEKPKVKKALSKKNESHDKPGAVIIEGHVQGLSNTRSLGEAGIPVYVVDKTDCIARYSKYCKKFFRCPDFILDEFVDFLINLAVYEKISNWVLVPSNDHSVYTISKHKERLLDYYKVITPGLGIIENIYDKAKLIEKANQVNVPVPLTQIFRSGDEPLKDGINYPVITKGRNGLSFYKAIGRKALLAHNEKELRKHIALIKKKYFLNDTLAQELIPYNGSNHTISFTAFCVDGEIKVHWSGVKLREHPPGLGTATFAKSIDNNNVCVEQSIPLLKKLKYTGVCEVEYLWDPGTEEYKLIEINPRTWLWVGLARECGVDYAKMIYSYVNGYPLVCSQSAFEEKYWINPVTDIVYSTFNMVKGKLNPLTYLRSLFKRSKVNALFMKGDIKPGWIYVSKIIRFIKDR